MRAVRWYLSLHGPIVGWGKVHATRHGYLTLCGREVPCRKEGVFGPQWNTDMNLVTCKRCRRRLEEAMI